jgi:hypothetical protein
MLARNVGSRSPVQSTTSYSEADMDVAIGFVLLMAAIGVLVWGEAVCK